MNQTIFINGRFVLPGEVVQGAVSVKGGVIDDVSSSASAVSGALDLEGDYLLPGLVELHTDHLETHMMPRSGVLWPSELAALMAHDAQLAGAGITTVFDSLCVGEPMHGSMRKELLELSVRAVRKGTEHGLLRAEHFLHLRCEVSDPELLSMLQPQERNELVRLVSVMDHTPGQRQWTDLDKYRQYHRSRNFTDQEFEQAVSRRLRLHARHAGTNRAAVLRMCRDMGVVVASHDDTTAEHVREAVGSGIAISEFPTSLEAAREAKSRGMTVVMGAPNMVRGESHSGNVSAKELARQGLLDVLSSDYLPVSMLAGAFALHRELDVPLPQAVDMVSAAPAAAVGLLDRGRIAPGLRADLVRVTTVEDLPAVPVVRGVWRGGERVA